MANAFCTPMEPGISWKRLNCTFLIILLRSMHVNVNHLLVLNIMHMDIYIVYNNEETAILFT